MGNKGRSRAATERRGAARLLACIVLAAAGLLVAASAASAMALNDYDHEWHNSAVTVNFTSSLGTATHWMIQIPSNATTWYDVDGPSFLTSQTFSPAYLGDVGSEPQHYFYDGAYRINYQGRDAGDAVVDSGYFILKFDTLAPYTRVSGVPAGWAKPPVNLVFTSSDDGSGVSATWANLNDGFGWNALFNDKVVTLTANGANTVNYEASDNSVDANGFPNLESERSVTVRVDNTRPVPAAYANVSARYGAMASLRYKATETWTPTCAVKIVIKRGTITVRTISLGQKASNTWFSASTKANLARGTYTWYVYATDLAGNTQSVIPHRTLRIY
jgi:hypothetical protein